MKNAIRFNFFGAEDQIYFNIARLQELEAVTGKTINGILSSDLSITLLVQGLMVGLRHVNGNRPEQFYVQKIEEYMEGGGSVTDLWEAVTKALAASGILGKQLADVVMGRINPDTGGADQEGKNVPTPKRSGKAKDSQTG